MWWIDESRPLPENGKSEDQVIRYRQGMQSSATPPNKKRLRLPISDAQAAANLMLQESGVNGEGETKVLRDDIRSLEAKVKEQRAEQNEKDAQNEVLKRTADAKLQETQSRAVCIEREIAEATTKLESRERWVRETVEECTKLTRELVSEQTKLTEREQEFEVWQCEVASEEERHLHQLAELESQAEQSHARIVSLEEKLATEALRNQRELAGKQVESSEQHARTTEELHDANRQLLGQAAQIAVLQNKLAHAAKSKASQPVEAISALKQQHSETVAELQAKLDEVVLELDCAMNELHLSGKLIEQMRGEHSRCVSQLYAQIEQADEQSHHNAMEAKHQRLRADKLQATIDGLQTTATSQSETILELRANVSRLTELVEELHGEHKRSATTANQLRQGLDDLTLRHRALLGEHSRVQSEQESQAKQNRSLAERNRELTLSVDKLSVANEQLNRTGSEDSTDIDERVQSLTDALESQKQASLLESREAQKRIEELSSTCDHLSSELQEVRDAAAKTRADYEEQVAHLNAVLHTQQCELTAALSESERVAEKLNDAIASIERQRNEHEDSMSCSTDALANANARIEQLTLAVEHQVKHRSVAERESKRLSVARSQRIGFLAKERESLQQEIAALREDTGSSPRENRAA
ncbi:MAG: hypothetical protein ACR2NZ_13480 [Rubripirellula sp.]